MSNFPILKGVDLNDLKETGIYVVEDAEHLPMGIKGTFPVANYKLLGRPSDPEGAQTVSINGVAHGRSKNRGEWGTWWFLNKDGLWEESK